jgi:tripartite-type tricarboxylate transporter receptor subunit TctC
MMMRALMAAAAAILVSAAGAPAQESPGAPLTIVVPFAAGGPGDRVAQLLAGPMAEALGREVRVEQIVGGGGTVGAAAVARAAPDGNTVLLYHVGMATGPALYKNLPYDPVADFSPVGLVNELPMVLIGRKDLPPDDLKGLADYLKVEGEAVTFASAGVGSASHLCGLLLMDGLGIRMKHAPYTGTAPAIEDLIAGKVDILCDQSVNATDRILAGAVKAYATTAPARLAALPDVPTAAEAGLPAIEFTNWNGLFAPAGTPEEAIGQLAAALRATLADKTVIASLAGLGSTASGQDDATPAALKARLQSEIERWQPLIRQAGVQPE